jgi:hypothetical protein
MSGPGGLRNYLGVKDRAGSPSSGQPALPQDDRLVARGLKFPTTKNQKALPLSLHNTGHTAIITPASAKNHFDVSLPQQYLQQYEVDLPRGRLEDTTLDSDFDRTMSEEHFQNGDAIDGGDFSGSEKVTAYDQQTYSTQSAYQPSQSMVQPAGHGLKHQNNTLSVASTKDGLQEIHRKPQPVIYGRFESPQYQQEQFPNLQHRLLHQDQESWHNANQQRRTHSSEPTHDHVEAQDDDFDILRRVHEQSNGSDESPEPRGGGQAGSRDDQSEVGSDEIEGLYHSPVRRRKKRTIQSQSPPKAVPILTPDYEDDVLKNMKYTALETQSWEEVPGGKKYELPVDLRGADVAIADKIKFFMGTNENIQGLFYGSLSMDEWDEAGDWFIEAFSNTLRQVKEKRKEKRAIVEKFEKEILKREKAVRGKSDQLDDEFKQMRSGGEGLLKGKKL